MLVVQFLQPMGLGWLAERGWNVEQTRGYRHCERRVWMLVVLTQRQMLEQILLRQMTQCVLALPLISCLPPNERIHCELLGFCHCCGRNWMLVVTSQLLLALNVMIETLSWTQLHPPVASDTSRPASEVVDACGGFLHAALPQMVAR